MEVYLIDTQHGVNWYTEANHIAREMADTSGLELIQTAGIISALSCNSSWLRNIQAAWEFCRTGNTGHLQIALDKAQRVTKAKGKFEILNVLSSPKLQNFFLNIAYPEDAGPVTIDRHAFNAARFGAKRVTDKTKVTPKRYRETANEYRKLAYKLGLKPHVLQAVVWSNYINL